MNALLNWIIFVPAVTALVLLALPSRQAGWSRWLALGGSLVTAVLSLALLSDFLQFRVGQSLNLLWLPEIGVSYSLGLDGMNLPLVLLTTLLTPLAFVGTWSQMGGDGLRQRCMTALVLLMETGALGSFLSQDLFLFYIFWEVVLIPAYLLVGMYGGPDRFRATLQFFLYTFAGSLLMLVGIGWLIYAHHAATGVPSASISSLQQLVQPFDPRAPLAGLASPQGLLFMAFGAAFLVKAPLFPLHAWLPSAYTQAPVLVTVYLAAILSKMGTYGVAKILLPLFPDAVRAYAPVLMWLAVGGIIIGAMLALAQRNLKTAIAYSSLSHVSYILLGLFSMRTLGISGALLQMVNHGIIIAGLFLVVGWLEERKGSLHLSDFGGWARQTPVLATFFMILVLASVALPGTNGFVGEFMVLVASFRVDAVVATFAAMGAVLGALYMLNIYQKTMFGAAVEGAPAPTDLRRREIFVMGILAAFIIAIGVAPQPYLAVSEGAADSVSQRVQGGPLNAHHTAEPSAGAKERL